MVQNIDVRFGATSTFGDVHADLAKLRAEAAALNATLTKGALATTPAALNPRAWEQAARGMTAASNTYRNVASASGLLTAQQIRATSETEKYTKALQKQKLTAGEMLRHYDSMKAVYRDQLRYQRMTANYLGTDANGRGITDITIPTNVPKELDTLAQRTLFVGEAMKSASQQTINMGKNAQWAGHQLTTGITLPIGMVGAAAGVMAFKADKAMTQVTKVYDVAADAMHNEAKRQAELDEVRRKSWELLGTSAREYGQSLEDTLAIEEKLAATGVRGEDLFASTKEASRIALLGDLDVQQTTDMTVALQNAFRDTIKTSEDLADTFNYMNAVENATSLSLQDIATATPRAASGLAQLGVDAKEMTAMMVAMAEAGVPAAEGANALKSATARILNPAILAKASEIYKEAGANIDLSELSDASGANLLKFMQLLGQAENRFDGLTKKQKASARASLFGTYQFNRLTAVLENVNKEGTQAARALGLMDESAESMAAAAEREVQEKMKSLSGQMTAAWQNLRVEMANAGEPFLKVAIAFTEAAGAGVKFFNEMPEWAKNATMIAAAVAAIAGPVIMLGGLMMNLGGQFVKGLGRSMTFMGKLAGAVGLVNKEEQANELTARAMNAAMAQQQKQTSTLTSELNVLSAAYQKAAAEAKKFVAVPTTPSGVPASTPVTPTKPGMRYSAPIGPGFDTSQVSYSYRRGATQADKTAAREDALLKMEQSERKRLATQAAIRMEAQKEEALRQKIDGHISGANVGMAAMAAGTALTLTNADGIANSIGQWLIIGTIVVPAVKAMGDGLAKAVVMSKAMSANFSATGKSIPGLAGKVSGAGNMLKMAGTSLLGVLGPGGLIAAGVTAIGVAGYYAWNKSKQAKEEAKAAYEEQKRIATELESSTRDWLSSVGKVAGKYNDIAKDARSTAEIQKQSRIDEAYDFYNEKDDKGKRKIDPFLDMGQEQQDLAMVQKFYDLQVEGSMSVKRAQEHMVAMYRALGQSEADAIASAAKLASKWGEAGASSQRMSELVDDMVSNLFRVDKAGYAAAGKDLAEALYLGMASAESPEVAKDVMNAGIGQMESDFNALYTYLENKFGKDFLDQMRTLGIKNGEEFAKMMGTHTIEEIKNMDWGTAPGKKMMGRGVVDVERVGVAYSEVASQIESAKGKQDGLLRGAEEMWKMTKGSLDSVFSFKNAPQVIAQIGTIKDQAEYLKNIRLGLDASSMAEGLANMVLNGKEFDASQKKAADATQMTALNALLVANNMEPAKNFAEGYARFMAFARGDSKGVASEVAKLPNEKTISIKFDYKDAGGLYRGAMQGVQSEISDSVMDGFNERWDSRMSAFDDRWDASMERAQESHERAQEAMTEKHDRQTRAMERAQEAAQERLDRKFEQRRENIEKSYQKRIDSINKQIEAERKADNIRKSLFEKEKARLARLAEMSNTNIDFNTAVNEGRLDDAAKTLTNAGVQDANARMDAEQKAAEARTEARIKALEKKNERLEKQKDKELKNLQKLEERMRKHLQRVQDARRRALQKQQQDEVKALQKSQEDYMKSLKKKEEAERASLQRRRNFDEKMLREQLELFKSYTARNHKDLERWMKKVGISYDDFGRETKKKGDSWAEHFRNRLYTKVREAARQIREDNFWDNLSKTTANKLVKGMGFSGMKDFKEFVKTGKRGSKGGGDEEVNHSGGLVGAGGSGRGNLRGHKGLHRTEQRVLAQKGEYMVNRAATRKNLPALEHINRTGTLPTGNDSSEPGQTAKYGVGGYGSGFFGTMAAAAQGIYSNMFMQGAVESIKNNYRVGLEKERKLQMSGGGNYTGIAGTYGGRSFSAEQMKNAAIIASVGSGMAMSKRDLQIGIMTAIAESGLINVNYGDRDSLGLFQQRPSMGWGTPAQVTNPRYSSNKFFSVLKGLVGRNEMSPWAAAQSVQRSAFADGSNYQRWWPSATAIFTKGLKKTGGGYKVNENLGGSGGKHRPSKPGKGWSNTHDYRNGLGSPLYAFNDGVVLESYATTSGGSPGNGIYTAPNGLPYRSYGERIKIRGNDGNTLLYAHMHVNSRKVQQGDRVRGGQLIGYSGNTGNSTGPHTHFEVNGSTNASGGLQRMGIGLRTGGKVKYDNTPALLHKKETVLTSKLTKQFEDNVAGSGGSNYDVTIDLRGAYIREDVDLERAVMTAINKMESKLGRKRVVR